MTTDSIDEILRQLKNRKNAVEKILRENGVELGEGEQEKASFFKTSCKELKKLKVAAVMDEFTLGNFQSECDLLEVTSDKWMEQLKEFKPDLFFLESAWKGKDSSWYKKIANGSKELYELSDYCHEHGIPIIFWNKEDPVYTDTFMSAASCADFVFTTDFDCIERYKRTLQHNNVYLLHFSAQPLVHNPLEIHQRKDMFCFAGAYYHRYKERSMVFDAFADVFEKGKGLEIYDRNLGHARPEHAFPQRYNKMIVGTLKADDIHIAYKGYNYGINMNSVSSSQTMFARRVFELLASNTVSVGNYSRGTKNLFGDLTVCTNSADTMKKHLDRYCGTQENYRKYRLLGLRKVLSEHLCEDRLGFIAKCVFGRDMRKPLPDVVIVSGAETQEEKERVKKSFERQTYSKKTLVFNCGESLNLPDDVMKNAFIGAMSPDDYYGKNYLLDLVLSVRYSGADGFGKNCFYALREKEGAVPGDTGLTYKPAGELFSTRSIVKAENVSDLKAFAKGMAVKGSFLCTDEFNYCENNKNDKCPEADDIFVSDQGIALEDINRAAKDINYLNLNNNYIQISVSEMNEMCKSPNKAVSLKIEGGKFQIVSRLKDSKKLYIEFTRKYTVEDLYAEDNLLMSFKCSGDLNTENFCIFCDSNMKETGKASSVGGGLIKAKTPSGAKYVKILIRVKGSGVKEFSGITAGEALSQNNQPFLSRSDVLVIADHYPSYEDLYRYMFVHKRLMMYKENGLNTDMLCMSMRNESRYREFEGINVTEGAADRLSSVLERGRIKTVCVHFLNPYIWSVLKNYLTDIKLIVWSHGSDIQPWYRRKFLYNTDAELQEAKKASEKREALWKEVFEASEKYDIHFVYVSEFFKKQIEEDYGVDLTDRCSVIHNCIDTHMFSYVKKEPEQRFNIMTVKSFSTKVYANDITQQAILYLQNEPEFSKMTFDIYGDGARFEEDTKLIKKFPNVRLHRQFLPQYEIAALHKTHGVYIGTTRMDTQGVSRDEAMSSGLVPVANAVAAIPEFVDESCGILVEGEDARGVADAVLKLVREPELFCRLSENAAKRVRGKTSKKFTIDKETELINSKRGR